MSQSPEVTLHKAAGLLRQRGFGPTRLRMPATQAFEMDPETGFFTVPLPLGSGQFPGTDRVEVLKDGRIVVTVTEDDVAQWGLDENGTADRIQQLADLIGP